MMRATEFKAISSVKISEYNNIIYRTYLLSKFLNLNFFHVILNNNNLRDISVSLNSNILDRHYLQFLNL